MTGQNRSPAVMAICIATCRDCERPFESDQVYADERGFAVCIECFEASGAGRYMHRPERDDRTPMVLP